MKLASTLILFAGVASAACAHNPERLPAPDRQFYYNLDSEDDQRAYLRLKESERQGFLERKGLWAKWQELTPEQKKAALAEEVHPGYPAFAAHMAWGPPADVRPQEARNRHVEFETYIKCTSGPKTSKYVRESATCDGTFEEIVIAVENGVITEVHHMD